MPVVFAVHAHPDDIEFVMAGTLFALRDLGCELHTMNICNGSCGTAEYSIEDIVAIRRREAYSAAAFLGSQHHDSICGDLEVFYTDELLRRLAAVVRQVRPDIMLVPSPQDYMEDHMNTSRLAVTAAFSRGMKNYRTIPEVPPTDQDVAVYHASPHGLADGLGNPIAADFYVDVGDVLDRKAEMLSRHHSQAAWLDRSQGMGSYVQTMQDLSEAAGTMSGAFRYAEGWRRHGHLGFSRVETRPLEELLAARVAFRS